jgi:hypothetical protein
MAAPRAVSSPYPIRENCGFGSTRPLRVDYREPAARGPSDGRGRARGRGVRDDGQNCLADCGLNYGGSNGQSDLVSNEDGNPRSSSDRNGRSKSESNGRSRGESNSESNR